jgi:hypothetical protein
MGVKIKSNLADLFPGTGLDSRIAQLNRALCLKRRLDPDALPKGGGVGIAELLTPDRGCQPRGYVSLQSKSPVLWEEATR